MSVANVTGYSSPTFSNAVNPVKELVQKELGKAFASFRETPGKIDSAFSKAYSFWLRLDKETEQLWKSSTICFVG